MVFGTLQDPGDVILNRYEIMRLLGSGGWGRVYLANDRMLHRPAAIKQLLPRLADDPAVVSRFMREASVNAQPSPHSRLLISPAEENSDGVWTVKLPDFYLDYHTSIQAVAWRGLYAAVVFAC
jgi:serine/threonine protein kinase